MANSRQKVLEQVAATQLEKVEVAYQFAKLLKGAVIDYENFDGDSAKYLVDAINHVCS